MPFIVVLAGVLIIMTVFGYSVVFSNSELESPIVIMEASMLPSQRRNENMMAGEAGVIMTYQDGTYITSVPYAIPYGYVEPMEVSLELVAGNIKDASVSFNLVNPTSRDYQNWFLDYYKKEVVGMPLNDVNLTRIGGASLTNGAFDKAVAFIKQDANPTGEMPILRQTEKYNADTVFIDGEYETYGSYVVNPFLSESMQTTVTLKDGVIIDSEVSFIEPDPISEVHQDFFREEYREQIIGKSLYSASLARDGYASLTSDAFNDALEEVRNQAKG